jgi:hypothetical protein
MTTALVLLDSYVVGLWEDLLNRDGLFTGQRGIATDYGNAELGGPASAVGRQRVANSPRRRPSRAVLPTSNVDTNSQ